MDWTDLYLRTETADDLRAGCSFLAGVNEEGEPFWIAATSEWSLDIIGPLVKSPAVLNDDGEETAPAEIDDRFHANLRCTVEIAALVPSAIVTNPATPGRVFAGELPEAEPIFVYKLDLFERTTNAEAEAILTAMDAQPARIRMIFEAAQSFREDHELWPLLTGAATQLFGAERAAELLAPSA